VIGCGWAVLGSRGSVPTDLALALRGAGAAHVVTVADDDRGAAQRLSALLPGSRVAASADEAVGHAGVQAVYVATPAAAHLDGVLAAAAARRAVLIAAPLGADLADAGAIVEACDGLVAGTARPLRWHPAHLALADAVERGDIGAVTTVRIGLATLDAAGQIALGPAVELGHVVDLVGMLLGDDIVALSEVAAEPGRVTLAGETRRGVGVSVEVFPGPAREPTHLDVLGDGGRLRARGTLGPEPGGHLTLTRPDGVALPVAFDRTTSPVAEEVQRFSLAALGASPWGYHLLRDLRLQGLLAAASLG